MANSSLLERGHSITACNIALPVTPHLLQNPKWPPGGFKMVSEVWKHFLGTVNKLNKISFWKRLIVGAPSATKNLFARSISIPSSPKWSYPVLFSLPLYCMVLYGPLRPFKVSYCCITVLFSSVWSCKVFQGPV